CAEMFIFDLVQTPEYLSALAELQFNTFLFPGGSSYHHPTGSGGFNIRQEDIAQSKHGVNHRINKVGAPDYFLQYIAFMELDADGDAELASDLETLVGEGRVRRLGDRYHSLFAQLSRQSLSRDARDRRAASARLMAFLCELTVEEHTGSRSHPAIDQALDLMRSRVGVAYGLDELVADLGLNKSYFIRLFRSSIGVPPMKYAMNLKMSAAADLLRTTTEPLAAVAARVGFDDEYHFAKRFKQWSGTAPGRYRQQG
ncbi:MAG: AraC family transcriptional regulator, partial [Myxococcales bacterium]